MSKGKSGVFMRRVGEAAELVQGRQPPSGPIGHQKIRTNFACAGLAGRIIAPLALADEAGVSGPHQLGFNVEDRQIAEIPLHYEPKCPAANIQVPARSEEHTSELQSLRHLV